MTSKYLLVSELPCAVALWWEGHSQLLIYPVKEGGKLPTLPPIKRVPQSSAIVCSRISQDSGMFALGLSNGVVAVWNMKTSESQNLRLVIIQLGLDT